MIPKIIHYIWLGEGQKDRLTLACINSWRMQLKDYEIIEWNEDNLPIEMIAKNNTFFKECMKRRLWAFMSDYLRLYILENYGGIYLDTDVQVIRDFDHFLQDKNFLGMEVGNYVGTGIIGAEKGSGFIKRLLEFYDNKIWNVDYYNNPIIFSKVLKEDSIANEVKIYPQNYFSPFDFNKKNTSDIVGDEYTYCIHWYSGNWGMSRRGYVFLNTKQYKGILKVLEIARKNIGYFRKKSRKK